MAKEIIEPEYQRRRDELASGGFDIHTHQQLVGEWINRRPAIRKQDSKVALIAEKYILSEVDESQVEREKYGTLAYDAQADQTEALDVAFLPFSLITSLGLEVDPYQVAPHVNGFGNHSGIFDDLREISGNMTEKNISRDIHHLLRYVMAYLASSPQPMDTEAVMKKVIAKNTANYPSIFFDGLHPKLPKKLNPDELEIQYAYSRRSLKLIRYLHRDILSQKDRDYGLSTGDWKAYTPLIGDFTQGDANFERLVALTRQDLALTDAQFQSVKNEFTASRKAA